MKVNYSVPLVYYSTTGERLEPSGNDNAKRVSTSFDTLALSASSKLSRLLCLSREFPCLRSFFWPRSLLPWDSLDGRKLSSCWWAFWKCGCEKSQLLDFFWAAPPLNHGTRKPGERVSGATAAGRKFLPSDSDSSRNVYAIVTTISAQGQDEIIVSKAEMPLVSEFVHPKGLSLAAQRKVVFLREIKGLAYQKIAERVRNLQGNRPGSFLTMCGTSRS